MANDVQRTAAGLPVAAGGATGIVGEPAQQDFQPDEKETGSSTRNATPTPTTTTSPEKVAGREDQQDVYLVR